MGSSDNLIILVKYFLTKAVFFSQTTLEFFKSRKEIYVHGRIYERQEVVL